MGQLKLDIGTLTFDHAQDGKIFGNNSQHELLNSIRILTFSAI